jgi:hypothetical protein
MTFYSSGVEERKQKEIEILKSCRQTCVDIEGIQNTVAVNNFCSAAPAFCFCSCSER